jgi:hypothetical protein
MVKSLAADPEAPQRWVIVDQMGLPRPAKLGCAMFGHSLPLSSLRIASSREPSAKAVA